MVDLANFPYPYGSLNIGSHAYDWRRNTIYAQFRSQEQIQRRALRHRGAAPPVLHIMDSDNLTVRERLQLKGKSRREIDHQQPMIKPCIPSRTAG